MREEKFMGKTPLTERQVLKTYWQHLKSNQFQTQVFNRSCSLCNRPREIVRSGTGNNDTVKGLFRAEVQRLETEAEIRRLQERERTAQAHAKTRRCCECWSLRH